MTYDLAEELCEQSLQIRRAITLMLDFSGHVQKVVVSDAEGMDRIPQLESLLQLPTAGGLSKYYTMHTALGWHPPGTGEMVTMLQYHFSVMGLLMAGVSEEFSRKHGENARFCDAAFLLHPVWDEEGKFLRCEVTEPMTARALESESIEKWAEWAEPVYQQTHRLLAKSKKERAYLIGVHPPGSRGEQELRRTMDELIDLAQTAGAQVVGELRQSRPKPDPGMFIGSGKAEELALLLQQHQAVLVIADDTLSPAQQRNLEQALHVKVIDRTEVILDIFAQRARSREGQIQVELAQLQYLLPRLVGRGKMFSQQTSVGAKGGIATRGPGETQLETDRRVIQQRMTRLEKEAEGVVKHRQFQRQHRLSSDMTMVSLVGYTNAGKSTLLRTLTGADVLVENKLFATLDPTTRRLYLPNGYEILVTDTVGFIQKLPTILVKAFRATLEEAIETNLMVHVWDISHPDHMTHLKTVQETIESLKSKEDDSRYDDEEAEKPPATPIITVCNKIDCVPDWENLFAEVSQHLAYPIALSAKDGHGIDELKEAMAYFAEHQELPPLERKPFVRDHAGNVEAEEHVDTGFLT